MANLELLTFEEARGFSRGQARGNPACGVAPVGL